MAELVDALVSNTNAARRAGSIPALGTRNPKIERFSDFFVSNFKVLLKYLFFREQIKFYFMIYIIL